MAEFVRIIQNEWIKLFNRRRFLVVLLLGLILVAFYSFFSYKDNQRAIADANPAAQKQRMENRIQNLQSQLQSDPNMNQTRKDNINNQIKEIKDREAQNEQAHANPVSSAFSKEDALKRIANVKEALQNLSVNQAVEKGQLEISLAREQYGLDHQVVVNPQRAGNTAWEYMKQFLDAGTQVFIPLLCVLLVADMVSGEQTGGTIKLLLTRPASRVKILFAKYVTSVIGSFAIVAILLAALMATMFAMFGTDGGNEPVLVGTYYNQVPVLGKTGMVTGVAADPSNAVILTMQHFMVNSLLLALLATIAMCTLGFFCSVLVRSAAVSTGISMAVIIIGSIVVRMARGSAWVKYFLTPHFDLPFAWTGELSQQFGIPMSLSFSMAVLLVWTLLMYAGGHYLFKKRDVLG